MTTVVNNPTPSDSTDGSAGWAVAVIILIAVIIAGGYWYTHRRAAAAPSGGTNINVTLPATGGNTNPQPAQ
ncbi:MAG: hypothetical protein NT019_01935 [Candidatus Adlerbacteria bacterium]|nr:hypothetical protein [Candidatus Adlerbacteria bacterium]